MLEVGRKSNSAVIFVDSSQGKLENLYVLLESVELKEGALGNFSTAVLMDKC